MAKTNWIPRPNQAPPNPAHHTVAETKPQDTTDDMLVDPDDTDPDDTKKQPQDENPFNALADNPDIENTSQANSKKTSDERTSKPQDIQAAVNTLAETLANTHSQDNTDEQPNTSAFLQQYLADLDEYDENPLMSQTLYATVAPLREQIYQHSPGHLQAFKHCLKDVENPEDAITLATKVDQWCINAPRV
jgi:DNA-binding protein Fis